MPLHIIRNSIHQTKALCRVHPTYQKFFEHQYNMHIINRYIGKIYHQLERYKPKVNLTEAVLTFDETSLYTMHVVGPRYIKEGEALSIELLKASYDNCLQLALKEGIDEIAFPLISAGGKGFPKALAFEIAKESIESFLTSFPKMDITLVVFEDSMYEVAKSYITKIESYIDSFYEDAFDRKSFFHADRIEETNDEDIDEDEEDVLVSIHDSKQVIHKKTFDIESQRLQNKSIHFKDIEVSETFARHLSLWLERKSLSDSAFYKRIAMSKQTFNKIINGKTERPNQKTVMLIAFGLHLNLDETLDLMGIVGYTFSKSSKFDLIVKYFIEDQNYHLSQLEAALFEITGQTLVNYH